MHTQTQMKMSLESDAFAAQNFAKRNSFHAEKSLTGCHRKKEPKHGYAHKIIA